jgi:hypothetical protein
MIQDMDKVTDNREKRVIASHFLERMVIVLDDTTVEALKAHRKR